MLGRAFRALVAECVHSQPWLLGEGSALLQRSVGRFGLHTPSDPARLAISSGKATHRGLSQLVSSLEYTACCCGRSSAPAVRQSHPSGGQRLTHQVELYLRQHRLASTSPPWKQQLEDLKRSSKRLLSAPQRTLRTAQNQLARTGGSIYNMLPYQGKKLLDSYAKPGSAQKVLKLHFEAFWNAHGRKVIAVIGVVAVYFMWRGMFGLTSMFLNLSETMAEFGFLALAAAMASFFYLWLKRRWTINPDSVYRLALRRLNSDPGVLEVLGAPVAGSDVRASVSTGGGLRLRGLWPAIRTRRLQMIFPLTGADRRGLVSLEAKKRKGQYRFKLLAVDVPTTAGLEQRLYLDGDLRAYDRGGVIRELRDPFLQALSLRDAYEAEDDVDDAADDAELAQQDREARAAAVEPVKAISAGQGKQSSAESQSSTYFLDRAASQLKGTLGRAWSAVSQPASSSGGGGSSASATAISDRDPASPPLHPSLSAGSTGTSNTKRQAEKIRNEPIASSQKVASNDSAAPLPTSRT